MILLGAILLRKLTKDIDKIMIIFFGILSMKIIPHYATRNLPTRLGAPERLKENWEGVADGLVNSNPR